MRQHTPYTYGMENEEPWSREAEEDTTDERIETVIVEGSAMSYRSYERRGEGVGGP